MALSSSATAQEYLFEAASPAEVSALNAEANEVLETMRIHFGEDEVRVVRLGDPHQFAAALGQGAVPIHVPINEDTEYFLTKRELTTLDNGREVWSAELSSADRVSWQAPIRDVPDEGTIVLLRGERGWYGTINAPEGVYHLKPVSRNLHALGRYDWAEFPEEGTPLGDPTPQVPPPPCDEDPDQPHCVPPPVPPPYHRADVLVVYTQAGRTLAINSTSASNFQEFVDLAEAESNLSFSNSTLQNDVRISVVATVATSTVETNTEDDLPRLRNTSNQYFTETGPARENHHADIVVLIGNYPGECGRGYLNATASFAFAVVHASCATGTYTFGHEIGHNYGADHDVANAQNSPYPYGHGYLFNPPVVSKKRTIMAYDDGTGSQRVANWSNPNVDYLGVPTGTSQVEHNARVLRERAETVSSFRAHPNDIAGAGISEEVQSLSGVSTADESPTLLRVTPNPATEHATVSFGLAESETVQLSVYDLYGREVVKLHEGTLPSGNGRLQVDTSILPAGIYVCRLEAGHHVETTRMTIIR